MSDGSWESEILEERVQIRLTSLAGVEFRRSQLQPMTRLLVFPDSGSVDPAEAGTHESVIRDT